jgi:pimeloyl-ACP methyl ester carboxylesterase
MTAAQTPKPPSTDLVVVLPGITGSTLVDAEGRLVWGLSAGSLMRTLFSRGESLRRLRLPDGIGDNPADDGIRPDKLMPDHGLPGIWTPIKSYDPLIERLQRLGYRPSLDPDNPVAPPGNLLEVPYDWRLSNRHNGRRLAELVTPALERWRAQGGEYADAQVVLVCHSMGGLVARWYLERGGGAELTRKLVTFGTPWRGAAKTVEQLVNGVHKGLGPLSVDLTEMARSLPGLHQLLPEYACLTDGTELRKTTETTLPDLDSGMVADAMRFHTELQQAEAARPGSLESTHMIVGARQPTWTTITLADGRAVPLNTIGKGNEYGDATVPLPGAVGHGLTQDDNRIRRIVDQHGNLHRNPAALDELEEILTATPIRWRPPAPVSVRVTAPDLTLAGQPLTVAVDLDDNARHALAITLTDDNGHELDRLQPRVRNSHAQASFEDLPPGAYTVTVTGNAPASPVTPVSTLTLITDPTAT